MRICSQCGRTYPDETDFCSHDGTRLSTAASTPPRTPTPAAPTASSDAPTAVGTLDGLTLFRRYRILRPLGKGGMGSVFLAEQIGVGDRLVALKILQRNLLDDPKFVDRFHSEAASAGRIRHSNVVTIYESGQEADGTPYIAMEYLEGESLGHRLRAHGPLPIPEAVEVAQQAARGLNAAHRLGIIHRDLKPDNVFLTHDDDGRLLVKVLDFGIAKLRESSVHTQTGGFLGTPAYMSFEQASGMRSESLDARSDIYSLGVVAYEMLSGRLPFESDTTLGFVRQHLTEDPAPLHDRCPGCEVPPGLEQVIMRALAKRREDRQASAIEFGREFATAAGITPYPTPTESQWSTGFGRGSSGAGSSTPPPAPYPSPAPGSASRASSSRSLESAVATPPPALRSTPTPSRATPPAGQAPVEASSAASTPLPAVRPDQAALDARAAEIQRAIERERLSRPSHEERRYARMQRRMQRMDRQLQGLEPETTAQKFRKHPLLVIIGIAVVLGILFSGGPQQRPDRRPEAPKPPPAAEAQNGEPSGGTADNADNNADGSDGLSAADREQIKKKIEQGTQQAEKALRDALSNVKVPGLGASPDAGPAGGHPSPHGPNLVILPLGTRVILPPLTLQPLDHPVTEGTVVAQQNVDGGLQLESADIASEIVNRAPKGSTMTLEIFVNEDGSVFKGRHLSGDKRLAKAVIDEAKEHWHFSPPLAGGVPVKAIAQVTVQF